MSPPCIIASLLLLGICVSAGAQEALIAKSFPEAYAVDYPVSDRFCSPIRTTFYEVTRTVVVSRGKRFRQKTNGGYGLAVVDKVAGKNLLHVGADLGWYQVGEPVFAVADGVVRLSTGPELRATKSNAKHSGGRSASQKQSDMAWGNVIAVEHILPNDEGFATTIYGHLDTKRMVQAGDVVKVGQPLGTIGKQHVRINGGYKPHLHFAVRKGRLIDEGDTLPPVVINGRPISIAIKKIGNEEVELTGPEGVPSQVYERLRMSFEGQPFRLGIADGKLTMPSRVLWACPRLSSEVIGYDLTTDLWYHPIAFLRKYHADTNRVPLQSRR